MKLYICSTYYHIYITLLKYFAEPFEGDLVICDDIPTGELLAKKINVRKWFRKVFFVTQKKLPDESGKNPIDWVLFQHKRRAKLIKPLLPFDLNEYTDIYIYHDGTPLGMYLADVGRKYHLIEDSLDFYKTLYSSAQARCLHKRSWKYGIEWAFNAGYFPLGGSHLLIDIEVNDKKDLQIEGQNIIECPRDTLETNLTDNQKVALLEVFDYTELDVGDRTALVLTQPLHKDGVVPAKEDQRKIYSEIIQNLQKKGYLPVIKPHPRDEMDYSNLGCQIINRFFPIELFTLAETRNFPCVAAVNSSGLKRLNADRKLYFPIGEKETDDENCLY